MNIDKLKEVHIDYDTGVNRFSNRAELYEKFLVKFFDDPLFTQLKKLLDDKNYEDAFKCAHTLKGLSGNLSMTAFYDIIAIFVEKLRNHDYDEQTIMKLYNELVVEYQKMKEVIITK